MPARRQNTFEKPTLSGHAWTPKADVRPRLLCAMRVRELPEIRSRRITHGQWALDYPYTAGLEVRARRPDAGWTLRPPHVAHLYPPSLPYWERRCARRFPNPHEEVYLIFKDADDLRFLVDPRAGYARFTDPDGALEALLAEAVRIGTDAGQQGFWRAQSVLCGVIGLLVNARRVDRATWRAGGGGAEDGPSGFARLVEARLRERLGERVTLDEIARAAGVSASTLTHRYRAETGRTPMQTLRGLRLTAAKGLLAKGWKLKEVAAQTGFVDAFHLSRTFKRMIGQSPRDYLGILRGQPGK